VFSRDHWFGKITEILQQIIFHKIKAQIVLALTK